MIDTTALYISHSGLASFEEDEEYPVGNDDDSNTENAQKVVNDYDDQYNSKKTEKGPTESGS